MTNVIITLTNGTSDFDLEFKLIDHSVTKKWLKHLQYFIDAGMPWDDPYRFYNFPGTKFTKDLVVQKLAELAQIIKDYAPDLIQRDINNNLTQDDLNYLHHVFEVYHGLYDQQDQNEFFRSAPKAVQDALGDLNIWIHRYETLNGIPRFVATWKFKPYRDILDNEDYQLFDLNEQWGDLIVNYCEIGKTLYDLWHDNDIHIDDDAFQPLSHVCFDCTVRFSDSDSDAAQQLEQQIWQYYDNREDFFKSRGYTRHDPKLSLGYITLGKLQYSGNKQDLIDQISEHQQLKSIRSVDQ